jgi:aryl-alcohol dehydrogenase-like predicted oxidoreductase
LQPSLKSAVRLAHHLPDAVAVLDVHLTDEEIRTLDEPYSPHLPTAF